MANFRVIYEDHNKEYIFSSLDFRKDIGILLNIFTLFNHMRGY